MKNLKPFGPSIGKTLISKRFVRLINKEIDNKIVTKKNDYSSKLASQIKKEIKINKIPKFVSIFIGSIIGFMSGIVGIGGGIFLSPLLFLMKAGYPKHITSSASLFILINSIFGIAGQLTKDRVLDELINYWPLFLIVFIGGQIGSLLNIKFLSNKILALLTSFLVIFVAIRMGIRLLA